MTNSGFVHRETLADAVREVSSKVTSLGGVIDRCCDRIDAMDGAIQALLPWEARRSSLRASEARVSGPLRGALLAAKDIYRVDGFETRAGSKLPPSLFEGSPSPVVQALVRAGGLLAGKSRTTEFAYFVPGPTRNPHDPGRTPGGSSSGSAAAVAAGFVHLATGTQTIGSVIRPASFCGVVGFVATRGRISNEGIVPFAPSCDLVGWFTQDLEGTAMAATAACPGWRPAAPLNRTPVLGVPVGPYLSQAEIATLAVFDRLVERLAGDGCEVRRVPVLDDVEAVNTRHRALCAAEFAKVHREWFAGYGHLYGDESKELIASGLEVDHAAEVAARDGRDHLRDALERVMVKEGLDAWIAPSTLGPAPVGLASTGRPTMSIPWTHAGMPAVTLPLACTDDAAKHPLGVQLIGRAGRDEDLLVIAGRVEAVATTGRSA